MMFQDATEKFAKFKSSGAPTIDGVKFRSRGVVYDLDFDLQLIDGKVVVIAKVVKPSQNPESSKSTKSVKRNSGQN